MDVITWERLSGFRTANALSIGYLGAIAVPLYKLVEPNLAASGTNIQGALALAFLASIALAVGHLANEVFCPQLVRTYPSFVLYHKSVAEFATQLDVIEKSQRQTEEARLRNVIIAQFPGLPVKDLAALTTAVQQVVPNVPSSQSALIETYESDWHSANLVSPQLRYAIAILYGLAAFLGGLLVARVTRDVGQSAGWF